MSAFGVRTDIKTNTHLCPLIAISRHSHFARPSAALKKKRRITSLLRRQISTKDRNWFFLWLDHSEKYCEQYQKNDSADNLHLHEEILANVFLALYFRAGRSFISSHFYLRMYCVPRQENLPDEEVPHQANILAEF